MSRTHMREVQETNGDLVDVVYFCSAGCWSDSFAPDRVGPATAPEGGHPHYVDTITGLSAGIAEGCTACVYDDRGHGQACADHMRGADCSGITEGGECDSPDVDYDVYCGECGVRINGEDPPNVVNLIDRPPIDPHTGVAAPIVDKDQTDGEG